MREFFKVYTKNALILTKKTRYLDYALLFTLVFCLILLKPFGIEKLDLKSIGFWLILCIAGFCIYAPIFYYGEKILLRLKLPYPLVLALLAILAGFIMSFAVTFIISIYYQQDASYWTSFPVLFPKALVIGAIVICLSVVRDYIKHQNDQLDMRNSMPKNRQMIAKFMQRIPIEFRGNLLCLEMNDHYVKAHTDKGSHMILMRFKDAISELGEIRGLQVHRSWWVSESAIRSSKREGRKHFLILGNNLSIPVSRTYLPEVEKRSLL